MVRVDETPSPRRNRTPAACESARARVFPRPRPTSLARPRTTVSAPMALPRGERRPGRRRMSRRRRIVRPRGPWRTDVSLTIRAWGKARRGVTPLSNLGTPRPPCARATRVSDAGEATPFEWNPLDPGAIRQPGLVAAHRVCHSTVRGIRVVRSYARRCCARRRVPRARATSSRRTTHTLAPRAGRRAACVEPFGTRGAASTQRTRVQASLAHGPRGWPQITRPRPACATRGLSAGSNAVRARGPTAGG